MAIKKVVAKKKVIVEDVAVEKAVVAKRIHKEGQREQTRSGPTHDAA
jgi:hypothetical protein